MKRVSAALLIACLLLAGCEKGSSIQEGNADPLEQNIQGVAAGELNSNGVIADQGESDPSNDANLEEQAQASSAPDNAALIEQFYGLWSFKDDHGIFLELEEGKYLTGVKYGDLFSSSEFTVTEVNSAEQSMIIEGYSQDIVYGDDEEEPEKIPFKTKLYLKNNGKELLYVHDYLETKIESEWFK